MKLSGADNLALLFVGFVGGFFIVKMVNNTKMGGVGAIDSAVQSAASLLIRGIRNNNPFNIRISSNPWQGKIVPSQDTAFEQFDTAEHGIRAGMKLLNSYMAQGVNTVRSIITRFAPSTENDTTAYIAAVSSYLGVAPDDRLTSANIPQLAQAIIKHENGVMPYSVATLDAAFQMTGIMVA